MSGLIESKPFLQFDVDGYVQELRWTGDASKLLASSADGEIALFDTMSGSRRWSASGHDLGNASCDIGRDGSMVVSCGQDTQLRCFNGDNGAILSTTKLPAWGERVRFSPDETSLAVATGKNVLVFHPNDLRHAGARPIRMLGPHTSTVADLAFCPVNPVTLATTSYGSVALWNVKDATEPRKLEWQGSSLVLAWSPDARFIATGDQDSTVHFWFSDSGQDLRMYGFETKVLQLSWDYSGQYLATGGGSVPVIWDCSGKRGPADTRPTELVFHQAPVRSLKFSHSRRVLISADGIGSLAVWEPFYDSTPITTLSLPAGASLVSFSPDDKQLAVALEDGGIMIFKTLF